MSRRQPIALAPEHQKTLDEVAREHVVRVLEICGGNQSIAAKVLGVDRKTVHRRLRGWGLLARD